MGDHREIRRGFMCATDFQFHLGDDVIPASVYCDVETLKLMRPCVNECGIVEVEVSVVQWVQRSDYSSLIVSTPRRTTMDDLPELPPLPETRCLGHAGDRWDAWPINGYDDEDMRSFALEAVRRERERCALVVEYVHCHTDDETATLLRSGWMPEEGLVSRGRRSRTKETSNG